jgi:WD40 repeat protein/serine/threonine protein kinase/tetratricopeptide (TPR) repeat protein
MNADFQRVKDIFLAALEREPGAPRAAYLNEICGQDRELKQRVEALLARHEAAGSFLESPASAVDPYPTVDETADPEQLGMVIGPYKLLQQIGEGGMGTVYLAEQTHPVQRKVALKIIRPGMDSRQVIARFEAERQALALMDHPNIAKVLDAGTTPSPQPLSPEVVERGSSAPLAPVLGGEGSGVRGRPYFVMELVKGVSITRYCDEHHLTPRERLELFVPVCQAVQHAHQKGIIHRDLKPSNVLVALYDGKPVPKVIDFGVAKAMGQKLTDETLFTQFGQVVGTLEYMSPEQAEPNQLDIDTRSDIYSLGVLLYELLTGTTPIQRKRLKEAAILEALRIIREEEPPKPSTRLSTTEELPSIAANRGLEPKKLSGLVRGELDWIVMKALDKDRNRRYETANGFAMDIQRYLADEPVQACPPSAMYRMRKFARRNKWAFVAASAAALVVVLAVIGLAVSNVLIAHEKDKTVAALNQAKINEESAKTQRGLAEQNEAAAKTQKALAEHNAKIAVANEKAAKTNELLARRRLYASQTNLAHQAWEAGNPARVLELLEGQRPKFAQQDLRGFEWYYLWRLCHKERQLALRGQQGSVRGVAFFPDGRKLASCSDREVLLWDLATGRQEGEPLSGGACVAISPDGKKIATGGNGVTLYDLTTMKKLANLSAGWVHSVSFSPDGTTLAAGTESGPVSLWDIGTGRNTFTLTALRSRVLAVAFSLNGRLLAAGTGWGDGVTKLWDLSANPPRVTHNLPWAKNGLAFLPDGKTLLIAGWGTAYFCDVTTGQSVQVNIGANFSWVSAAASRDGKTLAFGTEERTVKLWDRGKGHLRTYGHLKEVWCVVFSPDGKVIATGTDDGQVHIWDVFPKPESKPSAAAGTHLICAAFNRTGETLALGQSDGKVKLWDTVAGRERAILSGHPAQVRSVAYSADGKWLASASGGDSEEGNGTGDVRIWEAPTGKEIANLGGHKGELSAVAFSPDGRTLAVGSFDGTAKLWDVESWRPRLTLTDRRIAALAFSPDGRTLAAGGQAGVTLWDTATGQKQTEWRHPGGDSGGYVMSASFSPDGKILATAGTAGTGTIRFWDAHTGQLRGSLKGHTSAVYSLDFCPDGGTLASASMDGTVRLWDVATAQERISLKGPSGPEWPLVRFSPNGNTLAAVTPDGTVQLWHAAKDREALAYKNELDLDDADSPAALARTHYDLAEFLRNSGRSAEAEKAYARAMAIWAKLATEHPEQREYGQHLAYAHWNLAAVLQAQKRLGETEEIYRQALKQWQRLVDHWPDDQGYRHELAFSHGLLGDLLKTTKRPGEAEKAYGRALALQQEVVAAAPTNAGYRLRLAEWHDRLAELFENLARLQQAEQERRQALAIVEKLASEFPNVSDYRWHLGIRYDRLGEVLKSAKRPKEAEKAYRDAITVWTKLVADYNVEDHRWHLACSHDALGHLWKENGRLEEAAEAYRKARVIWEKLVAEFNHPDRRAHMLWNHGWLLEVLVAQAKRAEHDTKLSEADRSRAAQALRTEATQLYRDTLQRGLHTPLSVNDAAVLNNLAWFLATCADAKLRNPSEAVTLAKKAVELDPKNGMWWNTLGAAHYRAGDWKAAIEALNKSMELRKGGDNFDWFFLAMANWQLGKKDEARKWYDKAVEWTDKNQPKNEELRQFRDEAEKLLAVKKK